MPAHIWLALLPLRSQDPSSSTDEPDLHGAALWALGFSPRVAVVDHAVLLEVGASLRLFGGWLHLSERLQAGAQALCLAVSAPAATGLAALAVARAGQRLEIADLPGEATPGEALAARLAEQLDPLPLHTLTAAQRAEGTLLRAGCNTLGALRRLPRGGVSRRFGIELLHALDEAYAQRPCAFAWEQLPERFHARVELPSRVDLAPALLFGARRLLLQLSGFLHARQVVTSGFTLGWLHDAMRARTASAGGEITVRTAEPSRDLEHLSRLLGEHLAREQLEAPACELTLSVDPAWLSAAASLSKSLLPDDGARGATLVQALERISVRLGAEHVRVPRCTEDHRPEHQTAWLPWSAAGLARPVAVRGEVEMDALAVGPQPTWLLAEPLPLAARAGQPHYQGPLTLLAGPHRIEAGWWHRAADDSGEHHEHAQRDYWVATNTSAGLVWIFSARLAGERVAWYLHGVFA
ncbi:DNA polymerase Y family protein [uncultured Pseudacidovorax sp.]|uniref:Y-family DNA polymerase n=1 Tax=uncultured Pseudacidovorax sp. TaxID=679313 RepID=UPI0025E314C1|nr:DNA polymerase Y family protein [uncultured Pseudacidovorax sp.]